MLRIITPIILITVSILVSFFYIRPLYFESVSSLKYKVDIDDALQKNKEIEKSVMKLREDISSVSQSDFDKLEVILSGGVDRIRLLNDLNTIGLRHGIFFSNLRVDEDKIGGEISSEIVNKKGKSAPKTLLVNFSASSASYNNFKLFLKDIERSMKLMDINSISFSHTDSDETNPSGSYSYEVSLSTYWVE